MGFDPTGHWDWGIIADIFALVVSFSAAITVGTETAVSKFMQTGSKNSALSTGVLSALETFGVINNTINAVYYEFSEGNSDITSDSYTERYVSRWDRLDYVKQQTKSEHYDLNAWRYNSEYSVHMYGWYITGWAHSKNYGIVSTFAASCSDASIALNVWDNRWYVNVATVIFGIAGI